MQDKGASAAQDGLGVRLLSPALFFVAGSWRIVLPHKSQKKFIWITNGSDQRHPFQLMVGFFFW